MYLYIIPFYGTHSEQVDNSKIVQYYSREWLWPGYIEKWGKERQKEFPALLSSERGNLEQENLKQYYEFDFSHSFLLWISSFER